mgnify:CR=1 FL=1
MSKEERLELVKTMYETGMPLHTMNMSSLTKYSLGNDKPEYVARGMEILKNAIELAGDLGVRIVMIPGYDVFSDTREVLCLQHRHIGVKPLPPPLHPNKPNTSNGMYRIARCSHFLA